MRLPSGLQLVARREAQRLVRAAAELGNGLGLQVRSGTQACGEFFIQSAQVRESLHAVSGAMACNWETAGIFIGALRAGVPPLSLRVVSRPGGRGFPAGFPKERERKHAGAVPVPAFSAGVGVAPRLRRTVAIRAQGRGRKDVSAGVALDREQDFPCAPQRSAILCIAAGRTLGKAAGQTSGRRRRQCRRHSLKRQQSSWRGLMR